MKLYTEADVNPDALRKARIAIIGYGSQGRAHALNLKDSGHRVVVGARPDGPSWQRAGEDGLPVLEPVQAAAEADLVALLTPDMAQGEVFTQIAPQLKAGSALLFAHGFNIHYGVIHPPEHIDVVMVAPKGPGNLVRQQFEQGRGVPCLRAVHQDASGNAADRALCYAHGIGGTRAGVLDTTFEEETETDLFGEQAVLCGGVTELMVQGFETLVAAGYQPQVAYFECIHELKLIVDLLHQGGLARMHEFISETATYGDLVSGPRVIDEHAKQQMHAILADIRSGQFARDWIGENQAGRPRYRRLLAQDLDHPVEKVGRSLRQRMAWLSDEPAKKPTSARHRAA